jgi:hypothetical protein
VNPTTRCRRQRGIDGAVRGEHGRDLFGAAKALLDELPE